MGVKNVFEEMQDGTAFKQMVISNVSACIHMVYGVLLFAYGVDDYSIPEI